MTTLKIKITKEVLERSKWCRSNISSTPTSCAIALAVRDIFPKAYVDSKVMWFDSNEFGNMCEATARLPKIASDFIYEFDRSKPHQRTKMKEIEFEIEVPESVIESINIDEITKLLKNHPTLELTAS